MFDPRGGVDWTARPLGQFLCQEPSVVCEQWDSGSRLSQASGAETPQSWPDPALAAGLAATPDRSTTLTQSWAWGLEFPSAAFSRIGPNWWLLSSSRGGESEGPAPDSLWAESPPPQLSARHEDSAGGGQQVGTARVASHGDGLLSRPSGGPDRGASCPASCA